MIQSLLTLLHYGCLLAFGMTLSAAFAQVQMLSRRNIRILLGVFAALCAIQLALMYLLGEDLVWLLYPLITHFPLMCVLCTLYRKHPLTALAAVCTAYLCCQPAKWMGILTLSLTHSAIAELLVRITVLGLMGFISLRWLSQSLSQLFTKDSRSICIFASVPVVYYLFDYITGIYTDLWTSYNRLTAEFLPFFLCFAFLMFCFAYHKQYEQKADAQRSEQIVRMTVTQQAKELEAVHRSMQEVRLLRHDIRLLLSSLALCIQEGDREKAREMIDSHIRRIDGTVYRRFCENDMLNYVLSDYYARCQADAVAFHYQLEVVRLGTDEVMFCSILSNALDNALNAQMLLPEDKRSIRLLIKHTGGKLLLSVVNPVLEAPVFSDGLPVSNRRDHGYGTQSIRYLSQRLGGNCQFCVENGMFITRVIL